MCKFVFMCVCVYNICVRNCMCVYVCKFACLFEYAGIFLKCMCVHSSRVHDYGNSPLNQWPGNCLCLCDVDKMCDVCIFVCVFVCICVRCMFTCIYIYACV